jgi:predicted SnoaL-like aldol condensation-catalyzing enzyme
MSIKQSIVRSILDTKVRIARVLEDGDFIVAHHTFGAHVGFDVFRFEGDKLAQHWANVGELAAAPNPSGRTQLDGPTEITERERTAANKALIAELIQTVFIDQQLAKAAQFVDGYLQHNPLVGDGLPALGALLESLAKQGQPIVYDKLHRVLGEGNFVLAISEGRFGSARTAYYDLFRVAGGKVVEHWDVIGHGKL